MKFANLKYTGIPVGVLTLVAVIFLGSSVAQTEAVAAKFTNPAAYYKDAKCVTCHGKKAEKKFNVTLSDTEMLDAILKGKKPAKPPNMPGYAAKGLTEEQAKAMLEYMKTLKATP
jgi:mono/diheme cytochrome c family protein